jgi:hypothetical protein
MTGPELYLALLAGGAMVLASVGAARAATRLGLPSHADGRQPDHPQRPGRRPGPRDRRDRRPRAAHRYDHRDARADRTPPSRVSRRGRLARWFGETGALTRSD